MEFVQVSMGGQKLCPCCSTVNHQKRIETAHYYEYQAFCPACRFFERFRIQKWHYTIIPHIGMASAFYEPTGAELKRISEERRAAEQNAWANLEAVAC